MENKVKVTYYGVVEGAPGELYHVFDVKHPRYHCTDFSVDYPHRDNVRQVGRYSKSFFNLMKSEQLEIMRAIYKYMDEHDLEYTPE